MRDLVRRRWLTGYRKWWHSGSALHTVPAAARDKTVSTSLLSLAAQRIVQIRLRASSFARLICTGEYRGDRSNPQPVLYFGNRRITPKAVEMIDRHQRPAVHAVDVHRAAEMIGFMLENTRVPAISLDDHALALVV
jgi:hypothetical protein